MSEKEEKQQHKQIANEIIAKLGEKEPKPVKQIHTIVEMCGPEFAQTLMQDTLKVEADGGMLISSGQRRRSIGGVFFHLARNRVSEELREEIFYNWRVTERRRREYEAQFPAFDWANRHGLIEKLYASSGEIKEMNVNIIGRPGEIERREDLVVTTMAYEINEKMTLPRGVPSIVPQTVMYSVYISSKQWEQVEDAIKDPNDEMIVDGICLYDQETETFVIYATQVTTRKMRKTERNKAKVKSKKPTGKSDRTAQQNDKFKHKNKSQQHNSFSEKPAASPVPDVKLNLPADLPVEVAQKLRELHRAAATFRHKIKVLEEQPVDQKFGLEMTQKLLKNTEAQIAKLEKQHIQ